MTDYFNRMLGMCTRDGSAARATLEIREVGRSDHGAWFDLYVWAVSEEEGRPIPFRVTRRAAEAAGYGYSEKREALRVNGGGMPLDYDVAQSLAQHAGAAIYTTNHGWVAGTP